MRRDSFTRREFIRRAAAAGLTAYGLGQLEAPHGGSAAEAADPPSIVVATKQRPASLVRASLDPLGGMGKFVKSGDRVLVKPNIGWARKPEQAATTNPEVVAEIVRLCREAGAREVKVIDHSVDRPDALVLDMSGLKAAAEKAGARAGLASSPALYESMELPRGKVLKSVRVLRDLRRADVFINVPIAKVHSSTTLTLGCKNLMGTVWDRGAWHRSASLDQAIADFAAEVRPDLVILDAVRVLLTNGPKGPGRTETKGTVVAGLDPLAVDAYGATLLGRRPEQIGHLKRSHEMGVGEIDLERIEVKHV
jgi:uncharacterized protein (DUF362 family)